jgi:hypothetical protein
MQEEKGTSETCSDETQRQAGDAKIEILVIETTENDDRGTWRKKTLHWKNVNLGTKMHMANMCMHDREIGLQLRLGFTAEEQAEKWEKTRGELRAKAAELLKEHRQRDRERNN